MNPFRTFNTEREHFITSLVLSGVQNFGLIVPHNPASTWAELNDRTIAQLVNFLDAVRQTVEFIWQRVAVDIGRATDVDVSLAIDSDTGCRHVPHFNKAI